MLMQRPDVQIRVPVAQVDLEDSACGRHELQLRQRAGILHTEVVAQHRCTWDEIWTTAGEHPAPRWWGGRGKMRPEVFPVRRCAGEQCGQGVDLFGSRLPALEPFGGDGLGQGMMPGLTGVGHHVEKVEVDAR
ncbi:hypothetical protein AWB98_16250 [Mycolicibacterium conceptionense]|uniref:Uncharacterized protein n=1 Tax=Mycolicibacterium conceptionense TaxID=451644 RepID=A0ABX3VA82_9MYCO|nr:hypothetical protein AWB98_16250 [Mycolicibacterium conceptionense]